MTINKGSASTAQPQKRSNVENMYPLSPMQEGLLFQSLLSPTAGTYVPQILLSFSGRVEGALLKQAWEAAIARHSILRTGFYWEQRDQPFQVVYRQPTIAEDIWIEQDWQQLSTAEQKAKLDILIAYNRTEPFNLNQPPLMRLTWIRTKNNAGENCYYLLWCYHHLILDGWSASQLLQEVFQSYFTLTGGISLSNKATVYSYGDYIAWLGRQDVIKAESFWQRYLQDWAGPVSLPIQRAYAGAHATDSERKHLGKPLAEQRRPLSAKATQKLKAFAQTHKITLNTVVQAALGLVLSRYCDTSDVVFGATCAGRPAELPGVLSMVGLFINTLPVRVQVDRRATVVEWLQQLSAQQAETTDYEYVSLRSLQTLLNNCQSLFDTLLVFESYPVSTEAFSAQANAKADFQLENIRFNEWTHFPLTVLVSGEEQITFTAKYHADKILSDTVGRFLGHLSNAIATFVKRPMRKVSEVSLLCSVEKKQLADWNNTATDEYPLDRSLPDLFEAQVEKTPEAIALVFEAQSLTYQALNSRANQLAHALQAAGIGPEQRVAVYLERSLEMAIALLAAVKVGAAYVPIDPEYPAEQIDYMLADADVSIVLKDLSAGENQPSKNLERMLSPQNSVYVIYTSGSTGRPKGVVNTHKGLVNRLCWMQRTYGLTTGQRVLHKTPLSFDVSVWEIFWPLLNGATVLIAKPGGHRDSAYLAQLIQTHQVSIVHFVPSMLAAFLESSEAAKCTTLQQVICSGEALLPTLQNQFFQQLPEAALHNLYGPTEASIDVTAWQCQPDAPTVPIGRPISNTQIHLLDSDLNPVPIGIPGEIYIGGAGVARGYLNRPELTAQQFVPNPFSQVSTSKTSTLYKTGDLARYSADGTIEYLGRKDSQIKLRGIRIEPGEIEAALTGHANIRQAVVIARDDLSGGRGLVAYIVGEVEQLGDMSQTLSKFLKEKLPAAMVPRQFVVLNSLPLTPTGKLNRRALPRPDQTAQKAQISPRNETERAIATIWSSVLFMEGSDKSISADDNFFDLGGHSLSATRVNTRLRKHFDIALPLQSAFEHPTVESLATYIDAIKVASSPSTQRPTGHNEIDL